MNNFFKLLISVAVPLLIGFGGSVFTTSEIGSWYQTIQKPAWNPPNWIFGPVWTTLYTLMGIALFLVWKKDPGSKLKRTAMILFAIQLILNFFWSIIFFNQHEIGWALVEIVILWFLILLTIIAFASIEKIAAWLMVPYIAWVSFATILNFTIWQLNK